MAEVSGPACSGSIHPLPCKPLQKFQDQASHSTTHLRLLARVIMGLGAQAMQESARNADAERQQLLDLQIPDPPITVAVLFGGASPAPGLTLASARAISQFLHTSLGAQASSSDTLYVCLT